MIRRPPRSTLSSSSAASDVYKRQAQKSEVHKNNGELVLQLRNSMCVSLLAVYLNIKFARDWIMNNKKLFNLLLLDDNIIQLQMILHSIERNYLAQETTQKQYYQGSEESQ
eukprot:TRINITY_DN4634_c0_g1_i5.p2 TRINITY_DN4634_c0_g1~~TRINITY_DN4634_c0_g1_i5.p2  ORF type:complete len:111 (+),score=21.49 TRINITY_DN4634_c0_g1_i5:83-415(+)